MKGGGFPFNNKGPGRIVAIPFLIQIIYRDITVVTPLLLVTILAFVIFWIAVMYMVTELNN